VTDPTCFLEVNGSVHAILNWRTRGTKDDVIIGCLLNAAQVAAYRRMKAQNVSEAAICDKLFPEPAVPRSRQTRVTVDIDLLTKAQLVQLIRERFNKPLASLDKLNTIDLRSILASVEKG
jgi:hypothetical protein